MGMSDEKILQVLNLYDKIIPKYFVSEFTNEHKLRHTHEMIVKIREFLHDQRKEKVMRWLGFVQGVLWSEGIYTIEQLAKHNMPDGAAFSHDAVRQWDKDKTKVD